MSELGQSLQIVAGRKPLYVCYAPDSDQIPHRSEMTRRANCGHPRLVQFLAGNGRYRRFRVSYFAQTPPSVPLVIAVHHPYGTLASIQIITNHRGDEFRR
jgi:hypothetical protein